jgi:hypothetical protein
MGSRGLVGFINKGRRRATFNRYDSFPAGAGDAIITFILSLTDEQLEEMRIKVEKVSARYLPHRVHADHTAGMDSRERT